MKPSTPVHERIDLSRPESWPVRMLRDEVAYVMRKSVKVLDQWIASGRFPRPDLGSHGSWDRDTVIHYVSGGVKEYERRADREERRSGLRAVAR